MPSKAIALASLHLLEKSFHLLPGLSLLLQENEFMILSLRFWIWNLDEARPGRER